MNDKEKQPETGKNSNRENVEPGSTGEDRFQDLVMTIPDIVYEIDRQGRFTFLNRAVESLGYEEKDLLGKHFSEIIAPSDTALISRVHVLPQYQGCRTGAEGAPKLFDERRTGDRKTSGLEVRLVTKNRDSGEGIPAAADRETILAEVTSAGIYGFPDDSNREKILVGTVGVIRNITGYKQVQTALKESEERLRTIVSHTQAGIVVIDVARRMIVEANPAALRMIGAAGETVIGSECHRFICPADQGKCPVLDLAQEIDNSERTLLRRDGTTIPILKTVVPITMDGKPHLLESFLDISRQKQTEADLKKARDGLEEKVRARTAALKKSQAKLIQAEKIAALGTLTAGIAHELNNPMMGMLNYAQYCIKKVPEANPAYPVLGDIVHETKRCIDIVKNLLTFSRMENADGENFSDVRCSSVFDRVLSLLKYRIEKEDVQVIRTGDSDDPAISMKIGNIQQVFLNLVGNALDALDGCENKEIRIDLRVQENTFRVEVADNGCGIRENQHSLIFDPFYTTKPVGKGTGLGLSVSKGIIETHGGEIRCVSESGNGATFQVLLPLVRNRAGGVRKPGQ